MKLAYRIVTPIIAVVSVVLGIFLKMFYFTVGNADETIGGLINAIASITDKFSTTFEYSIYDLLKLVSNVQPQTGEDAKSFAKDAKKRGMNIVAIENNRPESKPLQSAEVKANAILVFGSESDGLTQELLDLADEIFYIEQLGSTRSINVGCASAVALYEYTRRLGYFNQEEL